MSNFQIAILIIFVLIGVVGLLTFSGVIPTPGGRSAENILSADLVMWGVIDRPEIFRVINKFNKESGGNIKLNYVQKDVETLELDLLRATSNDTIPDLILFPHDSLLSIRNELYIIPDTALPERDFRELFVDGSEIFLTNEGTYALPILIDPIVLFWNRDMFNNEKITSPPSTWSKVLAHAQEITESDVRGRISRSAIPLGEASNVLHFKEILSALIMQVGNEITSVSGHGRINSTLSINVDKETHRSGAESVLEYYISFADPVKSNYSWNSSLPLSIDYFAEGQSAMYVGFASDANIIREKNPRTNFDVAPFPQLEDTDKEITYGTIYGIGILKGSDNKNASYKALRELVINKNELQKELSDSSRLPPAKRIHLSERKADPFLDTFYKEAIIARAWHDPDPEETDNIFARMIINALSNKESSSGALSQASVQIRDLLRE